MRQSTPRRDDESVVSWFELCALYHQMTKYFANLSPSAVLRHFGIQSSLLTVTMDTLRFLRDLLGAWQWNGDFVERCAAGHIQYYNSSYSVW
jgi:hypothetical protein